MKIQYASDLHIEFPENKEFLKNNPLMPGGDVLLLAGDIVPFAIMDKHEDFFTWLSDTFPTTYWIPGNHEYYYSDISERSGTMNEKIRSNVFLINNTSLTLDSTKFIFTTLWSKIVPLNQWVIQQRISDFQVIRKKNNLFSIEDFNELHQASLDFLNGELKLKYSGKSIVVTHHVPSLLNYPDQHRNDVLNEAFVTDLTDLVGTNNIDYWIYGHHHVNVAEFTFGKTKMLTNQLGYIRNNENKGFLNNRIISI